MFCQTEELWLFVCSTGVGIHLHQVKECFEEIHCIGDLRIQIAGYLYGVSLLHYIQVKS